MTLREVKGHLMLAQKFGRVVVRDVTNMASFYVSSKEILSRVKVRRNCFDYSGMTLREVKGQLGVRAKAWRSGCYLWRGFTRGQRTF